MDSDRAVSINQLRQKLKDIIAEDGSFDEECFLDPFLRAKKYNVQRTEEFIREIMTWRRENNAPQALALDYNADLYESFRVFMDGKTKLGMPAWSANAGPFKFKETIEAHGKENVMFYWLQLCCKAEKIVLDATRDVAKTFDNPRDLYDAPPSRKSWLILDMKHFKYGQLVYKDIVSVFIALAKMATRYFPNLEGTLVFVNAGKLMELFFKLLRPVLNDSIDLLAFDTNEEKWQAFLFQHIDPSQLRPSFGGTRKIND